MANKTFMVEFKLPQLSASHYWHVVEVTAPSIGRAVDLGFKEIKKRPAVKGKRLKEATIGVKEVIKSSD